MITAIIGYLIIGAVIGVNMVFSDRFILKRRGKVTNKISTKLWMILLLTLFWPKLFYDNM